MRRLLMVLLALLCCAGLCLPVLADSGLSSLSSNTDIRDDGSCSVVISARLVLEEAIADLSFPVPMEADDITLNGEKVSLSSDGQLAKISLNGLTQGHAGEYHFTLRYTLPAIVQLEEDAMLLELPLLCGFSYPIKNFTFSLTFPGELTQNPVFTSSYYQESILSQMQLSVSGSSVTGSIPQLKDHESLWLNMPVTQELFPDTVSSARTLGAVELFTGIAAALAVIYYLVTMLPRRPRRISRASAPDGISAGELPLWFTGKGIDLSLLVVTWAQLGYLRIQVDDSGRVLLHKRMEMGNERSGFENNCFQLLFGKRHIIDGTGYHYATLCRSIGGKTPGIRDIYRRRTGNPKIFRILCLIPALLSGITLAAGLSPHSIFLRVFLAMVTTVFALCLQSGGDCLPTRKRFSVRVGLACAVLWLLLGIWASQGLSCGVMIAFQLLAGLGIAYGGKRTELGQQAAEQIFALRRHMRKVTKKELQQILKTNPGYFHQLAPYALALNVDRAFARRFARLRLSECTYLISGTGGQMTASEWSKLLRTTVQALDHKASRLPLEKLTGR